MENKFTERRKNYYIKKRFQRNFILKFCALMVIGAFISGAIIYLMSMATLTTTFENSRLAIKSTAVFILPAVLISGAIMIILIGFTTVIMTLFTSHRIAGPLYRIEKDIEELSSGNLNVRFHLRGGDEIKVLAANLDNMAQSLKSKAAAIKSSLASLEAQAKDASPEIKKNIQALKEAVSKFNVR